MARMRRGERALHFRHSFRVRGWSRFNYLCLSFRLRHDHASLRLPRLSQTSSCQRQRTTDLFSRPSASLLEHLIQYLLNKYFRRDEGGLLDIREQLSLLLLERLVCLCIFLSHPGGNGTCFAERGSRNTCQRDMRFERRKRDGESERRWKRKRGGRKLSEWSPIDEEDDNGARERESPTHFVCARAAPPRIASSTSRRRRPRHCLSRG